MKTVMKKMFSLLLVAVLLVGVMPFAAFADDNTIHLIFTAPELSGIDKSGGYTNGQAVDVWVNFEFTSGDWNSVGSGWRDIYEYESVTLDSNSASADTQVNHNGKTRTLVVTLRYKCNGTDNCLATDHNDGCAKATPSHQHSWSDWGNSTATCTAAGQETRSCSCGATETREVAAKGHNWSEWGNSTATCTEAGEETRSCACGASETRSAAAKGHDESGAAATCTTDKVCARQGCDYVVEEKHHTFSGGKCSACGVCQTCLNKSCSCAVTVKIVNDLKGTTETRTTTHGGVISLSTPAWVDGYEPLGWKLSTGGDYLGSSYTVPAGYGPAEITIVAKYDQTTTLSKYPVSVYARLKIGDEVQDVDLIHKHSTLLANDKILDYLKHPDTLADIRSKIASEYPGYSWSGNFHNAYGDTAATDNITVVDGSKSVYINLYAEQDQVLLYVYTDADCEDYEHLYELDGYKHNSVNDTVTASDVRSFLKEKLGSGISIKMFDEAGFEGYWKGKENTSTNYVAVNDGTTKVHVRVYNAYSSSSSSKADSSNPKTGDAIFAPMIVLGASATCLAVLFYLNKKRAY